MDITLDGISKEIYELHSFAFALQQEVIEDFMH